MKYGDEALRVAQELAFRDSFSQALEVAQKNAQRSARDIVRLQELSGSERSPRGEKGVERPHRLARCVRVRRA
ncbi:MAG: hypothetical protein DHS20C15_13670 [Planctomycetota bacterium]|nr:MAG: hypothetical protein DHS20C15_13670 [Planctomycetota bacterium]